MTYLFIKKMLLPIIGIGVISSGFYLTKTIDIKNKKDHDSYIQAGWVNLR